MSYFLCLSACLEMTLFFFANCNSTLPYPHPTISPPWWGVKFASAFAYSLNLRQHSHIEASHRDISDNHTPKVFFLSVCLYRFVCGCFDPWGCLTGDGVLKECNLKKQSDTHWCDLSVSTYIKTTSSVVPSGMMELAWVSAQSSCWAPVQRFLLNSCYYWNWWTRSSKAFLDFLF